MKTEADRQAMAGRRLLEEGEADDAVYPRTARRSPFQLFRSWFGSFALGVVTTLLVVSIWQSIWQTAPDHRPSYKFAKTDALPDVPWDTVMFEEDARYSAPSNDDSDTLWNLLLPPGRGYVFVSDSEERGLLPGEVTEFGDIYSVSMFHQLHCLARLRTSHFLLQGSVVTGELDFARQFVTRDASAHIQHCLDYLRQAIFCAGDMTLEWPKQNGSASRARVDGWNIPHKCKNRDAIDDFMNRYHFNGSINFDAAG